MKIICLGDLACPEKDDIEIISNLIKENQLFKDKIVIANLEGLIVKDEENLLNKYNNALFNNEKVLSIFENSKKVVFSLANNHIKDIPENFEYTTEILNKNNIGYVGASLNYEDILKPYEFEIEGKKIAVFGHLWKVWSNIIKKKSSKIFINDFNYKKVINIVKEYKEKNPNTMVIIYFHWSFDFETLPFPAHINIAHELVDIGVDMVLGGHTHLVNGGEIYKGKPIIYGFGNFYIPSNKFLNQKLVYTGEELKNIILEYDIENGNSKIYWINNNKLEKIEDLDNGKNINEYSKFKGRNGKEYMEYFKKNRTKKLLVPMFLGGVTDGIKEFFLTLRIKLIRFLKRIK